tara:strand:- start:2553 stop:2654 length:102 start_codon:yes stop_codon:yes gene_type:complete
MNKYYEENKGFKNTLFSSPLNNKLKIRQAAAIL